MIALWPALYSFFASLLAGSYPWPPKAFQWASALLSALAAGGGHLGLVYLLFKNVRLLSFLNPHPAAPPRNHKPPPSHFPNSRARHGDVRRTLNSYAVWAALGRAPQQPHQHRERRGAFVLNYCCLVPNTVRAFLRSYSVDLALYSLVCGHLPVRCLPNPTQLHSFTFNWRQAQKSAPKTAGHIGGRGEGVLPRSFSSVALMISLYLLHLFAWFLGASCVWGWQIGKEKWVCLGTSSKLRAWGLLSLCRYCNGKAFLETIRFFYFGLKQH